MTRTDPFFDVYDRDDIAYGSIPSAPLRAFLKQCAHHGGQALDLGAGAGRDTIELARQGMKVTAVDLSDRGLDRIVQRGEDASVDGNIRTVRSDVRDFEFPQAVYDAVIATTVLDHIPADDAPAVWSAMTRSLTDRGAIYVEVHTTEDPGSDQLPGSASTAPVSETAGAVVNYYRPNQLVGMAVAAESNLRILHYEERLEWDYTHGPEHQHGKAILLAVRAGCHPDWYGLNNSFARRE